MAPAFPRPLTRQPSTTLTLPSVIAQLARVFQLAQKLGQPLATWAAGAFQAGTHGGRDFLIR